MCCGSQGRVGQLPEAQACSLNRLLVRKDRSTLELKALTPGCHQISSARE